MTQDFYLGNPNLKKVGTEIQFTKDQIQEYLKCKEDPVYFARNYIKIISLDEGIAVSYTHLTLPTKRIV